MLYCITFDGGSGARELEERAAHDAAAEPAQAVDEEEQQQHHAETGRVPAVRPRPLLQRERPRDLRVGASIYSTRT